MCQLFESVACKIAKVDFDSTSVTLHETISRGDKTTATIACNISSDAAPCVRTFKTKPSFNLNPSTLPYTKPRVRVRHSASVMVYVRVRIS